MTQHDFILIRAFTKRHVVAVRPAIGTIGLPLCRLLKSKRSGMTLLRSPTSVTLKRLVRSNGVAVSSVTPSVLA